MLWLIALLASGVVFSARSRRQIARSCIIKSVMAEDMRRLIAPGFPVSLTNQAGVYVCKREWERERVRKKENQGLCWQSPPATPHTAELTSPPTEDFRRLHVDCFHPLVLPLHSHTFLCCHLSSCLSHFFRPTFYSTRFLLNTFFSPCACVYDTSSPPPTPRNIRSAKPGSKADIFFFFFYKRVRQVRASVAQVCIATDLWLCSQSCTSLITSGVR